MSLMLKRITDTLHLTVEFSPRSYNIENDLSDWFLYIRGKACLLH